MFLGVVLVAVALVDVVYVLASVMLVTVALMGGVHMARLVPVMLVAIALVDIVDMFASMMFVLVALVDVVLRSWHVHTPQQRFPGYLMILLCIKKCRVSRSTA